MHDDDNDIRDVLESAVAQFEQYRGAVSTAVDERPPGELGRALDTLIPELAFHEGRAAAAASALDKLATGLGSNETATALYSELIEHQGQRRNSHFLAGFAAICSAINQRS